MTKQISDTLMMIRPVRFQLNEQTAVNNYYQKKIAGLSSEQIQTRALSEFDAFVAKLRDAGITVHVFADTETPETPDSIFPNNWISFHESGELILYPMYAPNRRLERRTDLVDALKQFHDVTTITDLTSWEDKNHFLEGTGSLILDRQNRKAYAAISERTNPEVLADFSKQTGFEVVAFTANQTVGNARLPIYHTNVMMCLGEAFAVICAQSIDDAKERQKVIATLEQTGKEVILITEDQKEHFAGNMLQVQNLSGQKYIVMSAAAFGVLEEDQRNQLRQYGELLYSSLDTIEALGGGSARCMMAEVFLPKKV